MSRFKWVAAGGAAMFLLGVALTVATLIDPVAGHNFFFYGLIGVGFTTFAAGADGWYKHRLPDARYVEFMTRHQQAQSSAANPGRDR